MDTTKENIWNFAQNKPSLVVKDICEKYPNVDPDFVYRVLLERGIFKWLACRRDLIKLKNEWRDQIHEIRLIIEKQPKWKHQKLRGAIKTLNKCRQQVRKICHSERWRAPDFDRHANKFLERIEK